MSIKGRNFDLLSAVQNRQTSLYVTLLGFRASLSQKLGLKELPLITHDDMKAELRRRDNPSYPYGFFSIESLEIKKDQTLNKSTRRHSSAIAFDTATNAIVNKGYLFPVDIQASVHFVHNDPRDVLLFLEKALILGAVDAFSFKASVPGIPDWTVGVAMADGPVSLPRSEFENEADAGAFDIEMQFTISTKLGIIKDVAKINNEGRVDMSVGVADQNPGDGQ